MKSLKNHPFAVEAFFDSSLVLTFAVPKEQLQGLIPTSLTLDTFQDKWAFVAVAMVQTKALRPKGFPRFLGHDFFLIGYRIFVRFTTQAGKRLRGLYILQSATDQKKMEWLGNIFTHYNYTTTDILQQVEGDVQTITSIKSAFQVEIDKAVTPQLPLNSPFSNWKEARRYAGPLPFTFTYLAQEKAMLIIEGVRQAWQPRPVAVRHYSFAFFNQPHLRNAVLANAFEINHIAYYWKKGSIESCNNSENPVKV